MYRVSVNITSGCEDIVVETDSTISADFLKIDIVW